MPRAKGQPLSQMAKESCRLYALEGYNKTDAFKTGHRLRFPDNEEGQRRRKHLHSRATEFFARPYIRAYINEMLDRVRRQDIMREGRVIRQLEDMIEGAVADGNHTAAANLMDKKLKVMGLMRGERGGMTPEEALGDETLIEALAGGDPGKAKMLRTILVKDSFGDGETEH